MSKLPEGQAAQNFSLLTEALRRGRRRIRREYIPELASWLIMHAQRYHSHMDKYRSLSDKTKDKMILSMMEYLRHATQVLQTLLEELCDGFDGYAWNAATDIVSSELGVVPGFDLPDDLSPSGKIDIEIRS